MEVQAICKWHPLECLTLWQKLIMMNNNDLSAVHASACYNGRIQFVIACSSIIMRHSHTFIYMDNWSLIVSWCQVYTNIDRDTMLIFLLFLPLAGPVTSTSWLSDISNSIVGSASERARLAAIRGDLRTTPLAFESATDWRKKEREEVDKLLIQSQSRAEILMTRKPIWLHVVYCMDMFSWQGLKLEIDVGANLELKPLCKNWAQFHVLTIWGGGCKFIEEVLPVKSLKCSTGSLLSSAEELLVAMPLTPVLLLGSLISVALCSSSSTGCSISLLKYFFKPTDCMISFNTVFHWRVLLNEGEGRSGKLLVFYACKHTCTAHHVIMW